MLRINFDNENVYVSYGTGEWEVQPLNNSWLQLIGCIENGDRIRITDDRKELQEHQHNMSCARGIDTTNHVMLMELLGVYHPANKGILNDYEMGLIKEKLQLENRTVIELRNLRDFVVARLGDSDSMEDWDRMSAITHCIDMKLYEKGAEV